MILSVVLENTTDEYVDSQIHR